MKNKKGFTLIELLVVIAIIGILSSVVIQSLSNSRVKGYDSSIKQQLRNFRNAAEIYYNNQNPPTYSVAASCAAGMFADSTDVDGNPASYLVFSGLPTSITPVCGANVLVYAIKVPLVTSGGWCVDSAGANKAILSAQVAGSATVCP